LQGNSQKLAKRRLADSPNELISSAGKLKRVKRRGWIKKVGIKNPESVADHSFRVALLGAYASEVFHLDSTKVMRMSLIHDLAESIIGDKLPGEKRSERVHREEESAALGRIFRKLPEVARNRFISDWEELVENSSREARAVWQIDKLEMGLQMKEYVSQGYSRAKLVEFDPSRILEKRWRKLMTEYKTEGDNPAIFEKQGTNRESISHES
jgi:putative hydrolases of HD superfamily